MYIYPAMLMNVLHMLITPKKMVIADVLWGDLRSERCVYVINNAITVQHTHALPVQINQKW